jgi:hypothetical protein
VQVYSNRRRRKSSKEIVTMIVSLYGVNHFAPIKTILYNKRGVHLAGENLDVFLETKELKKIIKETKGEN